MNSQFNNNHFPPMQYPSQHPQFSRNVPNVWNYNSQQFHDNQDIDSDVMAESSDDTNSGSDDEIDDDGESDDTVEDEAKRLQDEETYIRFVKSVFCEEDDHFSVNSFTDEEDEEYRPDDAKEEDEDDDYVESRGGERDRVKNKELQGLVNECWQTIVGEAPVVPSGLGTEDNTMEDDNSQSQSTLPQERDTPSTHDSAHVSDQHNLQFHTRDASSPLKKRPLANSQNGASAVVTQSTADSNRAEESPSKASRLSGSAPHKPSVISSIVSQIFSGERPSEVCVEGMPVDAIRKLVARQMSMATQLLVQILLQADEKSECFTTAYTSLMELSNQREVAIKKAKLIQMNMRNVNVIHNYNRDQRIRRSAHSDRESHDETSVSSNPPANFEGTQPHGTWTGAEDVAGMGSDGESARNKRSSSAEGDKVSNSPEVLERRLTRSGAGQQGGARRSASVFDIPALANVHGLFDLIDEARRSMKARKSTGSSGDTDRISTVGDAYALLGSSSGNNSASRRAEELRAEAKKRAQLLAQSSVHTERIMRQSGMRAWQCLVPLLNYPLSENMMMRIDPSSLSGRSLFTPAEDDLLLRGIITLGENNWAKVRSIFLPSKEAQLLQFRFSQMTSLTAPVESNNFRRYQKLEIEYRNRDVKWTHEEDVDLLRGFQTFGEKWPLIAIFYLPNRKRKEIKQRWLQLQKVWQKGFQIHQVYTAGCRTELTPNASSFLHIINGHGSHHVKAELFPGEASMRSMGLVGGRQECDFEQDCLPDDDQQDWAEEEEEDGGEGQSNSFPSASSTGEPSPYALSQQYGSSASGSTYAPYVGGSNQAHQVGTGQLTYPDQHQQQYPPLGMGPGYSQQHLQQLMVMGGAALGAQRLVPSINTLKRAGIVPPKQSKQAQRQLQSSLFAPHTQPFDPSYLQRPTTAPSYPTLQYQPLSSHLSSHINLPVPHNSGYHFAQSARDLSHSASAHPALTPSTAVHQDAAVGALNNIAAATEAGAQTNRHAGVAGVESSGRAADTAEEEFTAGMIPEHSLVFAPVSAATKKSTKAATKQGGKKRNTSEASDKSGVAAVQSADSTAATAGGDCSEPKKKRAYKPRAPKVGAVSSKKSKGGAKDADFSGSYGGAADMSSLLSLPFDENTMDSAWASGSHSGSSREGLMSLLNVDGSGGSHLNYDTMMAHAFQNDLHPHLQQQRSDSLSPPGAKGDRTSYLLEKQHNVALASSSSAYDAELQQCEDQFGGGFSNISQMDSLFGPLAALQSPSKPPAPSAGRHINSPPQSPARATRQSGAPTDFAFSPPTTKLGNSSHIKRKQSVPRDGGDKRQKVPAGGLFASVMANINS